MLAVHGRTRAQGYRGEADWEKVVTEASFAVLALARRAGLWYDPLKPQPPAPPRP